MQAFVALVAGLLFGIGLILSGMANPAKVIGFLDLAGRWDPSLAFVMGGAILVGAAGFWFTRTRARALLGEPMRLPTDRTVDRRLVIGSLTFGIGWGLAGFCPGPALTSLLSGSIKPTLFVVAMVAGMAIFELLQMRSRRAHKLAN
ncbi:MAG: YeeE/YedE family protein [Herminiimonas sp.]|nr:YeeE/YedE family protein [Herminiimonas sp.]